MSPPPTVLSLVVADGVHRDAHGRAYILGVFHTYYASKFPVTIPQLAVYLALTDGRGDARLTLRLVEASDEDATPASRTDLDVTFPGPLEVVTLSVDLPPLTISNPGVYRWQLVCGGQVIADQRFTLVQAGTGR